MSNVKFRYQSFGQNDRWTERQTDNSKTICPDLLMQGYKKEKNAGNKQFLLFQLCFHKLFIIAGKIWDNETKEVFLTFCPF